MNYLYLLTNSELTNSLLKFMNLLSNLELLNDLLKLMKYNKEYINHISY